MALPPTPSPPDEPVVRLLRAFARDQGSPLPDAAPLADLWAALGATTGPAAGLAFAAWGAPATGAGALVPVLANSPDVATLLESLARLHPLFGSERIMVRASAGGAVVGLAAADGSGPAHPDTVDACFAMLCRTVRDLTQSPAMAGAAPSRVILRRPSPEDPSPYAELFPHVVFGAGQDLCEFDALTARRPVTGADPMVLDLVRPYAERQAAARDRPWAAAVLGLIPPTLPALGWTTPALPDVARRLAVSPRALQQYLRSEGSTFSGLLDLVQRERALALLAAADTPLAVIAARCGFGTPASFTRAVRRWTGVTPSAFRASATGPATGRQGMASNSTP